LYLPQRGVVLLEAPAERGQRGGAARPALARRREQVLDGVAEGQLVRVVQLGAVLEGAEEVRGRRRAGGEPRGQRAQRLVVLLEEQSADRGGLLARFRVEIGLVLDEHDDLAEAVDDLLEVTGQGRPGRGGAAGRGYRRCRNDGRGCGGRRRRPRR